MQEIKQLTQEIEGPLLKEWETQILVQTTEDTAVWFDKRIIQGLQRLVNGKVVFQTSKLGAIRRVSLK